MTDRVHPHHRLVTYTVDKRTFKVDEVALMDEDNPPRQTDEEILKAMPELNDFNYTPSWLASFLHPHRLVKIINPLAMLESS